MQRTGGAWGFLWLLLLLAAVARAVDGSQASNGKLVASLTAWSSSSLEISWTVAPAWTESHSIDEIAGFSVYLGDSEVVTLGNATWQYSLYGLAASTEYGVHVAAKMAVGVNESDAPMSDTILVRTEALSMPGKMAAPRILSFTGGTVEVATELPDETGGADLTSITVVVRDGYSEQLVGTKTQPANSTVFMINRLDAQEYYLFASFAINEAGLSGPEGFRESVRTRALENPGPCPAPTILNTSGGSVRLQLNPPTDDGGARISSYVVFMATNSSDIYEEVTAVPVGSSIDTVDIYTLPGYGTSTPLEPSSEYRFKALAVNLADTCLAISGAVDRAAWSSAWTLQASVPDAPPPPYYISATGGQITTYLTQPQDMKGSSLFGFSVTVNGAATDFVATTSNVMHRLNFLTAETTYSVKVAAVTNLGTTMLSDETLMRTSAITSPSAPRDVTVKVSSSRVNVQWSIPLDSGGSNIAGYNVIVTSPGKTYQLYTTTNSLNVTALEAATVYTIKVVAVNDFDYKSSVAGVRGVSFETLPMVAPGAPWNISALSRSGGAIEVTWNPPDESGGMPLTRLRYNTSIFDISSCTSSSCEMCNAIALGNSYEFLRSNDTCTLSSQCPDGSSTCCVTQSELTTDLSRVCARATRTSRFKISQGTNCTTFYSLNHTSIYYFGVHVLNSVGAGPYSTLTALETGLPSRSSFPLRLKQAETSGGSIRLSWKPPLDSGGGIILGYRVYRDLEKLTDMSLVTTFTDCGNLTSNTRYKYSVAALNASLYEGDMAFLVASTSSLTPPLSPVVNLISSTGNSLKITIAPTCDTGGGVSSPIYQVKIVLDTTIVVSSNFECCEFVVSDLVMNQLYNVYVQAMNGAGASSWAKEQISTSQGVPITPIVRVEKAYTYSAELQFDSLNDEVITLQLLVRTQNEQWQGISFTCGSAGNWSCPASHRLNSLSSNTIYQVYLEAVGIGGTANSSIATFSTQNEASGVFQFGSAVYLTSIGESISISVVRIGGSAGVATLGIQFTATVNMAMLCSCEIAAGCTCTITSESTSTPTNIPVGQLHFMDGQISQNFSVAVEDKAWNISKPLSSTIRLVGSNLIAETNTALKIGMSDSNGVVMFTKSTSSIVESESYAIVDLIRLTGSTGSTLTQIETFDITAYAGQDYIQVRGDVSFEDQQTNASVWIKLINDSGFRGERSFGVRIVNQDRRRNNSLMTHEVVIADDDSVLRAIPSVPERPKLVQVTGGEIELNCSNSDTSGPIQEGFLVRIAPFPGSSFYSYFNMTDETFILSGLPPRTILRFALAAWNVFGISSYSSETSVSTTDPSPPTSPRALQVIKMTGTTAEIEWSTPRDDGGSSITSYEIFVRSTEADIVKSYNRSTLRALITGLEVLTEYVIYVSASSISFPVVDFGMYNISLSVQTTNGTVPGQPPTVKVANGNQSGGSLLFEFQSPYDNGGWPITEYSLYIREHDALVSSQTAISHQMGFREGCTAMCGVNSFCQCSVHMLTINTSYEVYAIAYNAQGPSVSGSLSIAQTSEEVTIPSAPTNFRVSAVTSGNIELLWDRPLDLGGVNEVIGYIVYQAYEASPNSSMFVVYNGQNSPIRSTSLRGFKRNSVYEFEIIALNSASFCVATENRVKSQRLSVETLVYSKLSPPQSPNVRSATGGAIEVAWSPPDDLAGVPLYGYYVSHIDKQTNQSTYLTNYMLSDGTLSFTHYQLRESSEYCYAVTAWNQDGPSDLSETLCASTASVSTPSAVSNLIPSGTSGGQINISWESPLDTGGLDIVYYEIVRTELWGQMSTFSTIVMETKLIDSRGLRSDSGYLYRVLAFNSVYRGESAYVSVWTGAPALPKSPAITVATPFGGMIELYWQPNEDTGGLDITSYTISLWHSDMNSQIEERLLNDTTATFEHLLADTIYYITISASNSLGSSPSVGHMVATGSPDLPGIPPAPTALNILGGSVVVVVENPDYNGGTDITLILYQGTQEAYTFPVDKRNVTIYGLYANSRYTFRVGARNSVGETLSSDLSLVTGAISTPSKVENLIVIANSFDYLQVSWGPVTDTGGDSAMFYNVTYFRCGNDRSPLETPTTVVAISGTTTKLSSLTYSARYCISVVAVTGTFLAGPASSVIEAWTEDPLGGIALTEQSDISAKEDSGSVLVPVKRVNGSYGNISFSYFTTDDTAVEGVNFVGSNGSIELLPRVENTHVTIAIINDAVYNPGISFILTIIDDLTSVETSTRIFLLDDGDAGFLSFAFSHVEYLENSGIVEFGITRTRAWSPPVVIEPQLSGNRSVLDRFHLLEANLTFDEGVTDQALSIQIVDDSQFQLVADSINVSFQIMQGGALLGLHSIVNLTAADDGDVSLPHNCTSLRKVAATGGSIVLQWSAPIDRGASNTLLSYIVEIYYRDVIAATTTSSTESVTVYGLNASTVYDVAVRAANGAGEGGRIFLRLVSTTAASLPTAPQTVQLLSASSSSLLLSWSPPIDAGGTSIIGYKIYNVSASGALTPFGSVSCSSTTQCTIKGLVAITPYTIQVRAISVFSASGPLSPATVYSTSNPDLPDIPPVPTVTWVSAGGITIAMEDPLNVGGSEIREYRLFMKKDGSSIFDQIYVGADRNYTVYRLGRQTTYLFKFQAVNIVGPSDYSAVMTQTTLERSLPSAPIDVRLTNATGGSLVLVWEEPFDIGGRDITGYTITLTSVNATTVSQLGYDGRGDSTLGGTVLGLVASTSYALYVVAFTDASNCFGESRRARSVLLTANTTQPTIPASPSNFVAIDKTGGLIDLSWSPPKDTGGIPLTGFTVYVVAPTGGLVAVFASNNTDVTRFMHTGLTEATTYTYVVSASNKVGDSPASTILEASTTSGTLPSIPLNVTQLSYCTGGAIQIGWSPPIDSGGQPVSSYWVYRNGALIAQDIPAQMRIYTDSANLSADTAYVYAVSAYSQSGLGSAHSDSCSARTSAATAPKPPLLVGSQVGPGNITLSWTADADAGGLKAYRYEAALRRNNVVVGSFSGSASTYTFVSLDAASTYVADISTVNSVGSSQLLSTSFRTLAATVPGTSSSPLAVSVYGGNFTVQVAPPIDNGGTIITSMKLFEQTRGFIATLIVAPLSALQYNFIGATAMSNYVLWCSAVNVVGEGRPSLPIAIRTGPINRPGVISVAPQAVMSTGTSLSLSWALPSDSGGSTSLSYDLRLVAPNGEIMMLTTTIQESVVSGLRYSTSYNASVRAANPAGPGGWSPVLLATTQPDAAGQFNFVFPTVAVRENSSFILLPIRRSNGLSGRVTLTYTALSSTSAIIGKDFGLLPGPGSMISRGSIDFADQQNQSSITLYIFNDVIYESPDETFVIQIVSVSGTATLGTSTQMTVSILDDGDAGYVSFDKLSLSVSEDALVAVVPIIREKGNSSRVILQFMYNDITATIDRDYRKMMSNVVMEDGVTRAELRVAILNDRVFEFPDEVFQIRMIVASGGATVNRSLTNITIVDDGDIGVPGICPAPQLLSITGGMATLALGLPPHNGSSTGKLSNYVVRLEWQLGIRELRPPVNFSLQLGKLNASTTYKVTIAANNSAGVGPFSESVLFATSEPSLPGSVISAKATAATGGSIALIWSPPFDTGGVNITKYRLYTIGSENTPQLVAENLDGTASAVVYSLSASTTYKFIVQAGSNVLVPQLADGWGATSSVFLFATMEASLPGPAIINAGNYRMPTGGAVTLSWNAPDDTGGVPITSYNVYAKTQSRGFFLTETELNLPLLYGTTKLLNASTSYQFFVLARNQVNSLHLQGNMSVNAGSSFLQTTTDLSKQLYFGSVLAIQDVIVVVGNMSRASATLIPLMFQHVGSTVPASPASLIGRTTTFSMINTTAATLPRPPLSPTLTSTSGGALTVSFESPLDTGGIPILSFKVYVNGITPRSSTIENYAVQISYLQLRAVVLIGNLNPRTTYTITGVATNALSQCYFGREATSKEITFSTEDISKPGQPQVVATEKTGGGITLSIVDPLDTGGIPILYYKVYFREQSARGLWKLGYYGSDHRATLAGLRSRTGYEVQATVSNDMFTSDNSSALAVKTTAVSAPGACAPVTQVTATGGMLNVSWDNPLDNGGSPVTSFFVSIASGEDGSGKKIFPTNEKWYSFYGLTADSAYDVVVRARNALGSGAESSPMRLQTAGMTAPSGTIDVIAEKATGGAVYISFNEPKDLGGARSVDLVYQVFVDRDNVANLSYSPSAALSKTSKGTRRLEQRTARSLTTTSLGIVSGLDPENLYNIQIRPINAAAKGDISPGVTAMTSIATVPSAPKNMQRVSASGGYINLLWEAPDDCGGLPIFQYTLIVDGPGVNETQQLTGGMTSTSIYGLEPETIYNFELYATNNVGSSLPVTFTASTTPVTAPSAPRDITILSVAFGQVECSWRTPSDSGGDTVVSYMVTASQTAGGVSAFSIITTGTQASISGLQASVQYGISVVATNSLGVSSVKSVTRYVTVASMLGTPSSLYIGCAGSSSITLSWYPYTSASEYRVLRNGSLLSDTGNASTFTDEYLDIAEQNFVYSVQTQVDGTWGPETEPVSVTADLLFSAKADTFCRGMAGQIDVGNYSNNDEMEWHIAPAIPYSRLVITFQQFDLECDHDLIEILDAASMGQLWRGGCYRQGTFVYQSTASVVIRFSSDKDVSGGSFKFSFSTDSSSSDTIIPPPGGDEFLCSQHGQATISGSCQCNVGFTGEDCSNRIVCCSDTSRCYHPVCGIDPAKVIVVDNDSGDDIRGSGAMMDASEKGTASKAVRTLAKALSLSHDDSFILIYPGIYIGAMNQALSVEGMDLTIQTLKGSRWTAIDCADATRALSVETSTLKISGISFSNCSEIDGGAMKIVSSNLYTDDVAIIETYASSHGGGMMIQDSTVYLYRSYISRASSGVAGGGIYAKNASLTLDSSNVTLSKSSDGGAIALVGSSELIGVSSASLINNGADNSGGAILVDGIGVIRSLVIDVNYARTGGGIAINAESSLEIENVIVSNNNAAIKGGGILMSSKTVLQAQNVSINMNSAYSVGGGIYGSGVIVITGSGIEDTEMVLDSNTASEGGGIYLHEADAKIGGMVIQDGDALWNGGGIAAFDSSVALGNITLHSNNATSGGAIAGIGSAFSCRGGILILQNTGVDGGGIWLDESSLFGSEIICEQNSASISGGCLYLKGNAFLEGLHAVNNTAERGGGISTDSSRGEIVLHDIMVLNSSATQFGGGVWVESGLLNISNTLINGCDAPIGGGIYGVSTDLIGDLVVKNCQAAYDGGGLYLTGTSNLVGAFVHNNEAIRGGALFTERALLVVEDVILASSTAAQHGGGFYSASSSVWLTKTVVSDHKSEDAGGGMYVINSEIFHKNVTISGSSSHNGGGIYVVQSTLKSSELTSENAIVSENTATESGGNVYISGHVNTTIFRDFYIANGMATVKGGGLMVSESFVQLHNCRVVGNTAPKGGGFSVSGGSECQISNVNAVNNTGRLQGGGFHLDNSTLLHSDARLSFNSAPFGGAIFTTGDCLIDYLNPAPNASLLLVESNTATSLGGQDGFGGSMYIASDSSIHARGLDIYLSRADNAGGGIYVVESTMILENSQMSESESIDGGGIFIKDGSSCEISNCLLTRNSASASGGAIAVSSSGATNYLTLQNCILETNTAEVDGGAIFLENTHMDGSGNVLMNNTAHAGSGGAIAGIGASSVNALEWYFYNNTVGEVDGQYGGAIYFGEQVEAVISKSILLSNEEATLVRYGGLIYIQGPSSRLSVYSSRLGFGQAYSGGLIYAVDSTVMIHNSTLDTAYAYDFGGGIYAQNSDLYINDSSIVNNFAYYSGGAIFMKAGGSLMIINSAIELNAVQDSGGAIYLAPGAEVTCDISDTNLTSNTNYGYGSVMYVGRKNELTLTRCIVSRNGGSSTEAGAVYLLDSVGTIRSTIFEQNSAVAGAAIAVSRDGKLTLADSTVTNNSAASAGGALYGSVRAVATIKNCDIDLNSAIEGGAVFATGSSKFEFQDVRVTHNLARSFGGAVSFRGTAYLKVSNSLFHYNDAYTGGGFSFNDNASIAVTTTDFVGNSAVDFGGAIYVNRVSKTSAKNPVSCSGLLFDANTAAAGSDIYWIYRPWFVLDCENCHSYSLPNAMVATSATTVTAGWWPETVTSGVKLSQTKMIISSNATNNRQLDESSQNAEWANYELSDPHENMLWPTMIVRDYYGAIASQDNQTQCIAHVSNDEEDPFSFTPSGWVAVAYGYITFEDAEILSISRTKPYTLNVECSLSSDVDSGLSVNITVDRCMAGNENVDGLCLSCEKGKYSLDGLKCYLCPLGATCEKTDEDGVTVGVGVPSRDDGYYVSESRETLLDSSCADPSSWAAGDPCKEFDGDSLSDRIYRCSSSKDFDSYWNRKRIFACISGMEYYGCDTYDACVKDNSTLTVSQLSTLSTASLSSSFNIDDQCDIGYVGVMCATCDDDYYRVSNGSCRPCKDPSDPSVARMTRMLTVLPIVYALVGFALVCYFFYDRSEKDIMKYARAAKKFQVFGSDSEGASFLLSIRFSIQERVRSMARSLKASIRIGRNRAWLFGIAPVALPVPGFRPEKFKILLGFFQVFGGFKRTYEIPWPDDMSRLLDVYSLADFNFIDTTSVECFYRRDYFASYRLSLFAVLVLLMITGLLLVWGSVRYRVILSTLPRHCVKCGLPVFQMIRQIPQTLVKRATMVSMLKLQHKKQMSESFMKKSLGARMKDNLSSRAEAAFMSAKQWVACTRFGQAVTRIAVKTRLPASSSIHQTSCPTTHRISNDVQAMVVRSNLRLWRARIRLRLNYRTYQNRCIKLLFWILLLFYPDLSARVIGIFYCEEIGPHFYLTRDRRFRCYEGVWLAYLPLTIVLILFWVAGVPLLFWLILFIKRRHGVADALVLLEDPSNVERKERLLVEIRRDLIDRGKKVDEESIQLFESEMLAEYLRSRKLQEPTMIAQVGFIYHAYDARFWWFEVWDLGRKLFLNCVVGLLASSAANRMISGLVVLLVYLSVMLFFQPYKIQSDSALAGVTQIQLFITLFCGLILKLGSHTLEDSVISLLTYCAFATNICTIAYAVLSIVHERYIMLRHVRRQERENHRRAIQAHARKLWRRAYGYAFTEVYLRDLSIRPMPVHVILELARRERAVREIAELDEQLENTAPHLEETPRRTESKKVAEKDASEVQQ